MAWDEGDERPFPSSPPPRTRLPWSLLAVVLIVLVAGFALWRQVNQRIDTANETVEADVLASVEIIEQAAIERDRDLFVTFLSGRDPAWSNAITRAMITDQLYVPHEFGLEWLPQDPTPPPIITLSNDLLSAEVVITNTFAIDIGNGLTETVQLAQTAVYRRGSDRWLLSPPDPEFWGETVTVEGAILTITFPKRDEALARILLLELEDLLLDLCTGAQPLDCGEALRVDLTLSTDRTAVVNGIRLLSGDQNRILLGGLPTPSVIGLPVDDAAFDALKRGYARQLTREMIVSLSTARCCTNHPLFLATVDFKLRQMGILPTPVMQGLAEPRPLAALAPLWTETAVSPADQQLATYFVHFWVAHLGTLSELQAAIVRGRSAAIHDDGAPFEAWLAGELTNGRSFAEIEQLWLQFLAEQTGESVDAHRLVNSQSAI